MLFLSAWVASAAFTTLPPDMSDYAGFWTSESMYLIIEPKGDATSLGRSSMGLHKVSAPIHSFDGKSFKAGLLGFNANFSINRPPERRDGQWVMVVNGVELSRVDGVDPRSARKRLLAFWRAGAPLPFPRLP